MAGSPDKSLLDPVSVAKRIVERQFIRQMRFLSESDLRRLAAERGLGFSISGDDTLRLWQIGLLRADVVISKEPLKDDNRTLSLGDSKIVKAEGKASWSINNLRLTSDSAGWLGLFRAIEAGRETSGDAFKVEPPSDTDGFLAGVSGFAKDTLDTLYLHWQYTRWE